MSAFTIDYQMTVFDTDDTTILSPRPGAPHSDQFIVATGSFGAVEDFGEQVNWVYLVNVDRRTLVRISSGINNTVNRLTITEECGFILEVFVSRSEIVEWYIPNERSRILAQERKDYCLSKISGFRFRETAP